MKSNEKLEIPFIFHTIGKLIEAETLTRVFGYQRCNDLTETPIQHVSSVTPLVPCMSCQWAVDLHWWIYILSCLLELKWDGGAGALHYLWLLMTIVEEDTDWGKPCQRASSSSSWRSHVAHVLSIHPGWNTQRRETHPECCSMECVHGMCVHGGDVGVEPALIFQQMELCFGFWLTRFWNVCDPNVCCVVCRANNKRFECQGSPPL